MAAGAWLLLGRSLEGLDLHQSVMNLATVLTLSTVDLDTPCRSFSSTSLSVSVPESGNGGNEPGKTLSVFFLFWEGIRRLVARVAGGWGLLSCFRVLAAAGGQPG